MNLMSRHRLGRPGGRDMGLTSRPGLLNLGSRHHFEVATWLVHSGGGIDVATSFEVATCVGQCEVATWTGFATWTLFRSLFGHCSQ